MVVGTLSSYLELANLKTAITILTLAWYDRINSQATINSFCIFAHVYCFQQTSQQEQSYKSLKLQSYYIFFCFFIYDAKKV